MKQVLVFLFSILFSFSVTAQNKLDHKLSEFDIHINVDTNMWRRVNYGELRILAGKLNRNIDDYLKEQPFLAEFYYVPRDSMNHPLTTFITIDVRPFDEKDKSVTERSDSSINSNKTDSFLFKMSAGSIEKGFGKRFRDDYTGSVLYKFLTYMSVRKDNSTKFPQYIQLPRHFLIGQSKLIRDKVILIEYHCYQDQQDDYFPRFEKIIRSFH